MGCEKNIMNGKGGFGMTDKRFKMGESDIQGEMMFTDTQTNKIYWQEYFDEIIDLLNELAEENKQLKQKLEILGLNEKNDIIKMIDGKAFIRM